MRTKVKNPGEIFRKVTPIADAVRRAVRLATGPSRRTTANRVKRSRVSKPAGGRGA